VLRHAIAGPTEPEAGAVHVAHGMVYTAIGRYNKFHDTVSFYLPDNIPNNENFVLRLICH
jgi:hypothetical protein